MGGSGVRRASSDNDEFLIGGASSRKAGMTQSCFAFRRGGQYNDRVIDERGKPLPQTESLDGLSLESPGEHWRWCPRCGHDLENHKCKLRCPRCHYFMSCSDFD